MPFSFEEINVSEGTYAPSMIKLNSAAYDYWCRALYQRLCSAIKMTTTVEKWQGPPMDLLRWILIRRGFVACLKTPEFGNIFQPANYGAYKNVMYQPTSVQINNGYANEINGEYIIGENCEILKMTPDSRGIWGIIAYYAEKMAQLDGAINMAIINSKLAYFMAARDKAGREALKKGMDLINQGQPFVIFDQNIMKNKTDKEDSIIIWDRNVKDSYITTDLLRDAQTILDRFDREVGIPAIPYEKKERLLTAETDRTDDRARTWLQCLQESNENVTRFYGEKVFDFELTYPEGGDEDNARYIDTNGIT